MLSAIASKIFHPHAAVNRPGAELCVRRLWRDRNQLVPNPRQWAHRWPLWRPYSGDPRFTHSEKKSKPRTRPYLLEPDDQQAPRCASRFRIAARAGATRCPATLPQRNVGTVTVAPRGGAALSMPPLPMGASEPVKGVGDDGQDALCPACARVVLLENIADQSLFDCQFDGPAAGACRRPHACLPDGASAACCKWFRSAIT